MTIQRFPIWSSVPDQFIQTFQVTGASVGASAGSAGLDTRGKFVCTISKSTNTVTINFLQGFAVAPKVMFTMLTDNCAVNISTLSTTQLIFTTVERDDNTSGVNDADYMITMICDSSNKAYS